MYNRFSIKSKFENTETVFQIVREMSKKSSNAGFNTIKYTDTLMSICF